MQDIYRKLLEEAEARGDDRGACRLLLEMGHRLSAREDGAGALRCFQRALQTAVALDDAALEERALEPLGLVLLHLGGIEEAAACFQRLLDIVRAAADEEKEGKLLGLLGALDIRRQRLGEAAVRLRRATALLRKVGDPYGYFAILRLRSTVARKRGEHGDAIRLLDLARRMAEQADQIHEVNDLVSELAETHLEAGEIDEARQRLREGVELARALDDIPEEAIYLLRLSDLDRRAGDTLNALFKVRSALDLVTRLEAPDLICRASLLLGLILHRQGRERAARAVLAEAVQRARAAESPALEADALTTYAWLLVRARDPEIRDPDLAIHAADRARRQGGDTQAAPLIILSKAYRMIGQRERGRAVLDRAQALAKK